MLLFQNKAPQDLNDAERLNWLRLIRTENIGPITFYTLLERYGSAEEALEALPELAKRGGRKKPLTAPPVSQIEKELKALHKIGGRIITALDKEYPLALGATDDAPPVLSIIGNASLLNKSCVAIVGARNASLHGQKFANKLAGELGARDQIIVSGLARGIDTAAHHGALNSGTIAVVAGGIDVVYPEENQKLYDEIKDKGLIVAECPLGVKPIARNFPRRNRIVSGLSKAVIVVEATKKSGSLITARMAGEQGRDVMAVPGAPFDPRASGPNHLIREGATLIRSADDVMETLLDFSGNSMREMPTQFQKYTPFPANSDGEDIPPDLQETLLSLLSFTPIHIDELIRACHVSISALQMTVLELELAGRVKRLPGNRISLCEDI